MLTPHVITELNRFVRDEKAQGVVLNYDAHGRLTSIVSCDDDGKEINDFARSTLASWVRDAAEQFVEWFGIEAGGGSLYYSPEDGVHRG